MLEFVMALVLVFAIGMLIRWAIKKRNNTKPSNSLPTTAATSAPITQPPAFCSQCGQTAGTESAFCVNCGTKLK
jgi:hypothetical protein